MLVLTLDPEQSGYDETGTANLYRELLERLRQIPGIRAAALAQSVPLGLTGAQRQVATESDGRQAAQDRDGSLSVWSNTVSPGYFEIMRLGMVSGRGFDERDVKNGAPVVVVNQELASRLERRRISGPEDTGQRISPARNGRDGLVGKKIRVDGQLREIVGIVRTAKYFEIAEQPRPFVYLPYTQSFVSRMVIHLETEGAPANLAMTVRSEIAKMDPELAVMDLRSLDRYRWQGAAYETRIAVYVVGGAAGCGLFLALLGLHGLIASAVERRRREIGIRMAVGADQRIIIVFVLGHSCRIVLAGTTSGIAAAVEASRLIVGLIAGSQGTDAKLLAGSALLVAASSSHGLRRSDPSSVEDRPRGGASARITILISPSNFPVL